MAANDLDFLLVEDNPADLFLLNQMLKESSLNIRQIHQAEGVKEATNIIMSNPVNLVLLDLSLPDSFGIHSYLSIKKANSKVPVIILTGLADTEVALQAIKEGAQDYLIKGEFNSYLLSRSVQYSLERMQSMEKLRESEEKYRQMFTSNPFPSLIIETTTLDILEVNDAAIEKYGYSREEFSTMTILDLRLPEDVPVLLESIKKSMPGPGDRKLIRQRKKNGEVIYVEGTYYPITFQGGTAIQTQINDITERIRLEKQLKQEQEIRQRAITSAVLDAQEKERCAIGEELHDNINQIITSARLYIDMAMKKNSKDEFLKKAMEYTSMAIEENRKLSRTLISPQLKTEGLANSILELVNEIMHTSTLKIEADILDFDEDYFNASEKIAMYRIVQEQFNNILKHAQAHCVSLRLYRTPTDMVLAIKDDGKGFDTSKRRYGVGLTNIMSRAEVLKGTVDIISAPGEGCEIKITIRKN